jgi:excisionase family DNA binding protein
MQYATGQAVHDPATPRAYSQADARELLGGISRTTLHRLISAGKIRAIKIGRRDRTDCGGGHRVARPRADVAAAFGPGHFASADQSMVRVTSTTGRRR